MRFIVKLLSLLLPIKNLQLLRPFAACVDHGKNQDNVVHDAIRNDIGKAWNNQFTGSFSSSRPPALRKSCESQYSFQNGGGHLGGSIRAVFGDIFMNRSKALDCRFAEAISHSGGGSSCSVPQLRSQSKTFSPATLLPSSIAARPASISWSFHSS